MGIQLNGSSGADIISSSDGTLTIDGTSTVSTPIVTNTITISDKISHTGDSNTHIRFAGDDTVTVETAGSERLRIDSDGKIGMGVPSTSPGSTCNPDGNTLLIRAASTFQTTKGHIMLSGDGATNGEGPQIVFSESGSGGNFAGAYVGHVRTGGNSIGDLVFGTRATGGDANTVPTEKLRITSAGKFGFNDNNPERTIDVKGSNCMIQLEGSGGNGRQYSLCSSDDTTGAAVDGGPSGTFAIYDDTAGSARLRITSDGKFGFGGATPGGTPASKNVFLAIGDSDTGIVQDGDGQLELWSNATEVANIHSVDGYTSTKRIYTTGTGRFGQTRVNSTTESADNAFKDLIVGDHSGNRGISILSANGSHSTLGFAKSGALSDGYIQYSHNSTATSSWMRVKSSGQIILNTAGTDRLTVRAGSGATNDKIQINQSNGGFYHSHHSAGITPANGDWVYFGYVAYGSAQRGQFVVEWSSIHAPGCCYHGYAILEAGSSHGPDYDYNHSESLELIAYDSHGAHNFKAWKLVDSSSSGGSHLKIFGQWSGSTVQSGTFHMTVLPSKTMFGQTIVGATPAVDNNSYNGTRLTIDGRLQRGSTGFAPAQLRLNKSMFGIFHASSGLDTAGPVTTRGVAAGADGTIWCNYGGLSATRNSNIVGSYTPFAGMVAPCGAGARYLHVKFNITAGSMWLVDIKGYEYNGLWTSTVNGSSVSNDHVLHAIAGGYHYNNNALFNGKSAAYRGANPGWYIHNGYICCWIDTNHTGTGNRWGFYKFEGGFDGIVGVSQQKPACVLAFTYSTGTASAF